MKVKAHSRNLEEPLSFLQHCEALSKGVLKVDLWIFCVHVAVVLSQQTEWNLQTGIQSSDWNPCSA